MAEVPQEGISEPGYALLHVGVAGSEPTASSYRATGGPMLAVLGEVWTRTHRIVSLELTGIFDNHTIDVHRLSTWRSTALSASW